MIAVIAVIVIQRTLAAVEHRGDQVFAIVKTLADRGHDVQADQDKDRIRKHFMELLEPLCAEKASSASIMAAAPGL